MKDGICFFERWHGIFPFVAAAVFFLEKNIVDDIEILSGTLMAREVGIVLAWWYLVQAVITLLIQENQLTCMS